MNAYEIGLEDIPSGKVLIVRGYVNADAGREITAIVSGQLQAGIQRFCLDFSACNSVNSPGVTSLLELTWMVAQDSDGSIVFTGLKEVTREFFDMAGIFLHAREAGTREEGVALLVGS